MSICSLYHAVQGLSLIHICFLGKVKDIMEKLEQLYEGKAKKVFKTDDPELYIVDYKDDATALNGLKKGTIHNKGIINNRVTNHLMKLLEADGVPTHFVEELSDRETPVSYTHLDAASPHDVILGYTPSGFTAGCR